MALRKSGLFIVRSEIRAVTNMKIVMYCSCRDRYQSLGGN
jgi:hypothetical protein